MCCQSDNRYVQTASRQILIRPGIISHLSQKMCFLRDTWANIQKQQKSGKQLTIQSDLGFNNGAPLLTFVSLVDLCVRAVLRGQVDYCCMLVI